MFAQSEQALDSLGTRGIGALPDTYFIMKRSFPQTLPMTAPRQKPTLCFGSGMFPANLSPYCKKIFRLDKPTLF
jgi:hypothetical protein